MRTSEIMGMSARFIEPSFDALVDESFTGIILTLPAQEARLVVDEEDWPLALAVRDGEAWNAASFLLRPPIIEVIERFEELGEMSFIPPRTSSCWQCGSTTRSISSTIH